MRRIIPAILVVLVAVFIGRMAIHAQEASTGKEDKSKSRSVEQGRLEVRMLDDIYKGGIVTITEHYVTDEQTVPAGTAFKKLFVAAEKKGWHRVRLIDVSGQPYSDENVAEDEFEKNAVKQLAAGEQWVERLETREGKRHLRVATPIPVVFEKCIMCHDNYADLPKDTAIGALTYTIPLDGQLITNLTRANKEEAKK